MRELESGTRLAGRYSLVRKLGAGAEAEIWLATDKMTRASVALKILRDEDQPVAALRREWQLSIRLVHANIARVFEFHDRVPGVGHGAFYSMQFIEGPDIATLSGARLENILAPIGLLADALRYMHGKGVVHRDIKSSNILLDANAVPYFIDFGVASAPGDSTGGGSVIASSPQQIAGEAPASSDDIFAFGGLIYELVSGQSPYSSAATADDILTHVPPPLVASNGAEVPAAIQQLLAEMLDKDAAARPDAASVAASLAAAGFAPGPAAPQYVDSVRAVDDELIRSQKIIKGTKRPAPRAAMPEQAAGGGVSPRTLGISLAVLLAILLAVIFLLPKTVSVTDPAIVQNEVASDASQSDDTSSESTADAAATLPERDERVQTRQDTDLILGRLLSRVRTLEGRAVQRWGGAIYQSAERTYAAGDAAYLEKDFATAAENYEQAFIELEPLLQQVEPIFRSTLADAEAALENGDTIEALRLFDLAVAISPNNRSALQGLARAKNLDEVLTLTEQGLAFERDLELDAARQSFSQAIELDPDWTVAKTGLQRVLQTINEREFDQRMTEGISALLDSDFLAARAAFRMALSLQPNSPEPADGLQQVDQGMRLADIAALERRAASLENGEDWQESAQTYERILELDGNLAFAQEGLSRARQMIALHKQLDEYIAEPDSLAAPRTMQTATQLVVSITRMDVIGPRLSQQRDELTRLLKRAATPLTVQIVSDNETDVSIYKVGKLGSFASIELSLRPGTYVAVGIRPGYRDVRLEFRVAPEEEMGPVIVVCEERI